MMWYGDMASLRGKIHRVNTTKKPKPSIAALTNHRGGRLLLTRGRAGPLWLGQGSSLALASKDCPHGSQPRGGLPSHRPQGQPSPVVSECRDTLVGPRL